ncbi:MAG: PAP2 family protein, partial [Lysobacterales bacterium]
MAIASRLFAWLGAREAGTLAALLLAAAGVWMFVELADEVLEGETTSADDRLLLALRVPNDTSDPVGPSWVEDIARDVTGLGGAGVLTLLTLASAGFLVIQRSTHLAAYLLAAVASGTIVSTVLKLGFDRPRPDLVPHGQIV